MKRFYVTMLWDNWPEGGSYGTIVNSPDEDTAEKLCRQEMAELRADDAQQYEDTEEEDADWYLDQYACEWEVVDCFDLDVFITRHKLS